MAEVNGTARQNGTGNGSGADIQHELQEYTLPTHSLTTTLSESDRGKTPLVLCACGSFSPITYLHLRMFEMARDWARLNNEFTIIGAYLSPVGDAYQKKGLAPAQHRVKMCQLAVDTQDQESKFIMVDTWEAVQTEYQPTAKVLDHFDHEINGKLGGIDDGTGNKVKVRICLLGGADLVETFSQAGVWSRADLDHILCDYGAITIERAGTDLDEAIANLEPEWRKHIYIIHQQIRNDVSSTKIRAFLESYQSIRYLVPEPVIGYIDRNHLYQPAQRALDDTPSSTPAPASPNAASSAD